MATLRAQRVANPFIPVYDTDIRGECEAQIMQLA
jgi:hypothetical protein